MDRRRLIELAPQYYILAICHYFNTTINAASIEAIEQGIGISGFDFILAKDALFHYALRSLVEKKMLDEFVDDFGPTIYRPAAEFQKVWSTLKSTRDTPYYRYALDSDGDAWIRSAIRQVNIALNEHKIRDVDFQNPDSEWEPLPLERDNPKLQKATKKLDETIAAIDADNGYNATLPEEKSYVVENLKDAANKLKKDDTISYAYLKNKVIDMLDVVIRRFGQAAVGVAAQGAKDAILAWLKEIGLNLLHWLF
jgi:hypothetical protein